MNMNLAPNTALIDTDRASAEAAEGIAATIRDLYLQLAGRRDLRPGPDVDQLFGRLVRAVLATPAEVAAHVLADPGVRALAGDLRELCGRGETELERAWAGRIAAGESADDELARFPYLDNYRRLVSMELDALAAVTPTAQRSVAFVGAGPLPLSALLFARPGTSVHGFDRDQDAVDRARRTAASLGRSDVRFDCADATAVDLGAYDVVVLAALVGATPAEKRLILGSLAAAMRPGAVLLARSADGLRTLLYPAVEPDVLDGFDLLQVVQPAGDVINSAVLARVRGAGD